MPTEQEIADAKKAADEAAKAKADQEQADLDALALGDKGKAAIKAERDARRIADDEKVAAQAEARRLQKILDDADAAKRKDADDAAAKRGEFEALAATRETERDAAIAERDGLKAENDRWRALATAEVDAQLKALKAKAPQIAALDPGGDDLIARREWVGKAMAAAGETAETRGNGPNPKVASGSGPTLDQTKKELAASMGFRR